MNGKKRQVITKYMVFYELRNVTGNPFVHIFGIGMPIFMAVLITRIAVSEVSDAAIAKTVSTSVFLGIGAMIPMATVLMGYAVRQAQDFEKGIPERMRLFGIRDCVTICNRAVSELIFMTAAFALYFLVGILFIDLEAPAFFGIVLYILCMLFFSITCFMLGHAIAALVKRFSITYCIVMMVYFALMILGGMMGISYENMPAAMQAAAKLLPVTYFNKDFITIWTGGIYNFVPMVQSYLFFGAIGGILLFAASNRGGGRAHEKV